MFNTDQGNTTTQTAALYLSPDVRATALSGLRVIKENADMSSNAGRDVSLTLNTLQNNSQNEAVRITSGGNVDINGTPPWSVTGGNYRSLSISGQTASSSGFIYLGNGAEATNADFDLTRINICNGANIVSQIIGSTDTSADDDGRLSFSTKETTGSITERLRITSTGNIISNGGNTARIAWGTIGGVLYSGFSRYDGAAQDVGISHYATTNAGVSFVELL